ncbi:MAG: glycosyltransferase family 2 protein [Parafilimonas sp.]|nr:glycosyltransferase family 2 protein [Parafilimonas sp.]
MQLSIIIVSYNVRYYLEQCLHSVLVACKNIEAEIIVVDNNSEDKTAEYIQLKFPAIIFIGQLNNSGFAKANNIGLNIAKGEFILYLNPDTIVSENVLANGISFLNEHKQAGAVGVNMIDGNGNFLPESKRAFPSAAASFWKLTGIAKLFPHSSIFNKYALGNLNESKVHEVDVLSGAFFLSRKEILKKLNGFDKDFFMYGEDIDLSYRIQKAGYKNYYLGNNLIIHFKGESTKKDKVFVKNFYGAMKIFVDKHYKKFSALFLKIAISGGAFVSEVRNKSKQSSNPTKKNERTSFVLCGDEDAIKSAAAILLANNHSYNSVVINNSSINPELINLSSASNIVFCLYHLTYSNCIQFVQNNKNKFACYWHFKDSGSIISASNSSAIPQIHFSI